MFFLTKKLNSCFVTLKKIIFKTILELILKKLKNETGFLKLGFVLLNTVIILI